MCVRMLWISLDSDLTVWNSVTKLTANIRSHSLLCREYIQFSTHKNWNSAIAFGLSFTKQINLHRLRLLDCMKLPIYLIVRVHVRRQVHRSTFYCDFVALTGFTNSNIHSDKSYVFSSPLRNGVREREGETIQVNDAKLSNPVSWLNNSLVINICFSPLTRLASGKIQLIIFFDRVRVLRLDFFRWINLTKLINTRKMPAGKKSTGKMNPDLARERQKCTFNREELATYWIGDAQKLEEKRARGECENWKLARVRREEVKVHLTRHCEMLIMIFVGSVGSYSPSSAGVSISLRI